MSPDTGQSLRTVLCLANPSGMQAARWGGKTGRGILLKACPAPGESEQHAGWGEHRVSIYQAYAKYSGQSLDHTIYSKYSSYHHNI